MAVVCGPSLFDNQFNYLKAYDASIIGVEGHNIAERLNLSDLRIPYKQILKGRISLKPGQKDYLLNHLGIGDNVTFLTIRAKYDPKSVVEEDNYLEWKYYNNITNTNYMADVMVLSGNSTHRIPQIFITNPNNKYPVTLEVIIAVIDEEVNFFDHKPVIYFTEMVNLDGVTYDPPFNTSMGDDFYTNISGTQSYSKQNLTDLLIDYVKNTNGEDLETDDTNYILYNDQEAEINSISASGEYSMYFDITDSSGNSIDPMDNITINIDYDEPIVYFTNLVGMEDNTEYDLPYNTSMGDNFTASLSSTQSYDKQELDVMFIDRVEGVNGDILQTNEENYVIYNESDQEINSITISGIYSMHFNIEGSFNNFVDPDNVIKINANIE